MSNEDHSALYMKIFGWLTVWTVAEIIIAMPSVGVPRGIMIAGLAVMATIKASMVGLFYMHLKYEGKLIWAVILSPVFLAAVICIGFWPDAAGYYARP